MARPLKNNAEYFSHDADMRNNIKIKALRRRFSHKGYAVWCFILETLTDADCFEISFNEVNQELLAADFDISAEELCEIVEYCQKIGLLQSTQDGCYLYCEAHKRRLADVVALREKCSRGGKLGMAARWGGGGDKKAHRNKNTLITPDNNSYNTLITPDNKVKEIKVKEIKEKESKDREIVYPYRDISRLWNEICGGKLPKVKALNDSRRQKIKCRLSESGAKTADEMTAWAKELFERIAASSFMCGENNHQWTATFDWIFENEKNWVKVSEGNYDNKRGSNTGFTGVQNKLGVGEYITPDGKRTYGSGRANIPLSAPPRPSEKYQWSAESQNWIML